MLLGVLKEYIGNTRKQQQQLRSKNNDHCLLQPLQLSLDCIKFEFAFYSDNVLDKNRSFSLADKMLCCVLLLESQENQLFLQFLHVKFDIEDVSGK